MLAPPPRRREGSHGLLVRRARAITFTFLGEWKASVAALVIVSGAVVWAALTYAPSGTDRVVAVIVTLAGTLGISWKSVGASLGKTLMRAEAAVWAA